MSSPSHSPVIEMSSLPSFNHPSPSPSLPPPPPPPPSCPPSSPRLSSLTSFVPSRAQLLVGRHLLAEVLSIPTVNSQLFRFLCSSLTLRPFSIISPPTRQSRPSGNDGRSLELHVGLLFRTLGYHIVDCGGGRGDGGVDLRIRDVEGGEVAIQCKQYRDVYCGVSNMQQLLGSMYLTECPHGLLVSSHRFTYGVRRVQQQLQDMLAQGKGAMSVETWDGDTLAGLLGMQAGAIAELRVRLMEEAMKEEGLVQSVLGTEVRVGYCLTHAIYPPSERGECSQGCIPWDRPMGGGEEEGGGELKPLPSISKQCRDKRKQWQKERKERLAAQSTPSKAVPPSPYPLRRGRAVEEEREKEGGEGERGEGRGRGEVEVTVQRCVEWHPPSSPPSQPPPPPTPPRLTTSAKAVFLTPTRLPPTPTSPSSLPRTPCPPTPDPSIAPSPVDVDDMDDCPPSDTDAIEEGAPEAASTSPPAPTLDAPTQGGSPCVLLGTMHGGQADSSGTDGEWGTRPPPVPPRLSWQERQAIGAGLCVSYPQDVGRRYSRGGDEVKEGEGGRKEGGGVSEEWVEEVELLAIADPSHPSLVRTEAAEMSEEDSVTALSSDDSEGVEGAIRPPLPPTPVEDEEELESVGEEEEEEEEEAFMSAEEALEQVSSESEEDAPPLPVRPVGLMGQRAVPVVKGRGVEEEEDGKAKQTRLRFSAEEEEEIRQGVAKWGLGSWQLIVNESRALKARGRSGQKVKDKWRNLQWKAVRQVNR